MGRINVEELRIASEAAARKQAAVDAVAIADINKRIAKAEKEKKTRKAASAKKASVALSSDAIGEEPVPAGVPGGRLSTILSGKQAASVEAQIAADAKAALNGAHLFVFPPGKGPKGGPAPDRQGSARVPDETTISNASIDNPVVDSVDQEPADSVLGEDEWIAAKAEKLLAEDDMLDDFGAGSMAKEQWRKEAARRSAATQSQDIPTKKGNPASADSTVVSAAVGPSSDEPPVSPVKDDDSVARAYSVSLDAARRYNDGVKASIEKTPDTVHSRRSSEKSTSVKRAETIEAEGVKQRQRDELMTRIDELKARVSEKASMIADIEEKKIGQREKLDKRVASRMEYEKRFAGIFSRYFTKETMLVQLNREEDLVRKELYDMGMETRTLSAELDRSRAELKEAENDLEMLSLSPEGAFLREQIEVVKKTLEADPENVAQQTELSRLESLFASLGADHSVEHGDVAATEVSSENTDANAADPAAEAQPEEKGKTLEIELPVLKLFESVGIDREKLVNEIDGFSDLSYGQQLLVYRNYNQLLYATIEERGRETAESGIANDPWYKRIGKAMMKDFVVGKQEKAVAKRYSSTSKEGDGFHEEKLVLLRSVVEGVKLGPDCVFDEQGDMELRYATGEGFADLSDSEQSVADRFNFVAAKFSKIPHEWRYASTAKQSERDEFSDLSSLYEEEKKRLLSVLDAKHGTKHALQLVNDIDGKVRMTQFFSSNPDVENALVAIDGKSVFWKAALSTLSERVAYFGLGLVTRSVAGVVLGSVASGFAVGWYRAGEDLKKREKTYRKSSAKKRSSEAKGFSDAMRLSGRLKSLVDEIEDAPDGEKKVKQQTLLESRIAFTRQKLDQGLVNFGRDSTQAQLRLVQSLAQAEMIAAVYSERNAQLAKRVGKLLSASAERIGKDVAHTKRNYKVKKALQGAIVAGSAAGAGALIREYMFGSDQAIVAGASQSIVENGAPNASTDTPSFPDPPEPPMPASAEPTPGSGAALTETPPEEPDVVVRESVSPRNGGGAENDTWAREVREETAPSAREPAPLQPPETAAPTTEGGGERATNDASARGTIPDSAQRQAEIFREIDVANRRALADESALLEREQVEELSSVDNSEQVAPSEKLVTAPVAAQSAENPTPPVSTATAQEGSNGISKPVSVAWNEGAERAHFGSSDPRLSLGSRVRPDISLDSQDPGTEFRARAHAGIGADAVESNTGGQQPAPPEQPAKPVTSSAQVAQERPQEPLGSNESKTFPRSQPMEAASPEVRQAVERAAQSDIARGYLVRHPDKLPLFERLSGDADAALFGSDRSEAGMRGIANMAELGDRVEARAVMHDCIRLMRDPLSANHTLMTYQVPGAPSFEQMKNVGEFMMKASEPDMFGRAAMPVGNESLRGYLERMLALSAETGKTVKINGDMRLLEQLAFQRGK